MLGCLRESSQADSTQEGQEFPDADALGDFHRCDIVGIRQRFAVAHETVRREVVVARRVGIAFLREELRLRIGDGRGGCCAIREGESVGERLERGAGLARSKRAVHRAVVGRIEVICGSDHRQYVAGAGVEDDDGRRCHILLGEFLEVYGDDAFHVHLEGIVERRGNGVGFEGARSRLHHPHHEVRCEDRHRIPRKRDRLHACIALLLRSDYIRFAHGGEYDLLARLGSRKVGKRIEGAGGLR